MLLLGCLLASLPSFLGLSWWLGLLLGDLRISLAPGIGSSLSWACTLSLCCCLARWWLQSAVNRRVGCCAHSTSSPLVSCSLFGASSCLVLPPSGLGRLSLLVGAAWHLLTFPPSCCMLLLPRLMLVASWRSDLGLICCSETPVHDSLLWASSSPGWVAGWLAFFLALFAGAHRGGCAVSTPSRPPLMATLLCLAACGLVFALSWCRCISLVACLLAFGCYVSI